MYVSEVLFINTLNIIGTPPPALLIVTICDMFIVVVMGKLPPFPASLPYSASGYG